MEAIPPGKEPQHPLDRICLDKMEKGQILIYRDWNCNPSAIEPLANRYTD
jgi:hypothetical protein